MNVYASKVITTRAQHTLRRYESAKAWMKSLGVDLERGRFGMYRTIVEKYIEAYQKGRVTEQLFTNYINAKLELHDLEMINEQIAGLDDVRVTRLLRKLAAGPFLLSDEKADGSSVHSRNAAFELYMISFLARARFDLTLETEADCAFSLNNRTVFVECKRLQNEALLERRAKEAFKQIKRRTQNESLDPRLARGFAAVSFTKPLLGVVEPVLLDDINPLRKALTEYEHGMTEEYRKRFSRYSRFGLGLFMHYKLPVAIKQPGGGFSVAIISRHFFYSFCESDHDKALFDQINRQISRSYSS